ETSTCEFARHPVDLLLDGSGSRLGVAPCVTAAKRTLLAAPIVHNVARFPPPQQSLDVQPTITPPSLIATATPGYGSSGFRGTSPPSLVHIAGCMAPFTGLHAAPTEIALGLTDIAYAGNVGVTSAVYPPALLHR